MAAPPNQICPDAVAITPNQLPLAELAQADIDRIVAQVPGGVANVQDIFAQRWSSSYQACGAIGLTFASGSLRCADGRADRLRSRSSRRSSRAYEHLVVHPIAPLLTRIWAGRPQCVRIEGAQLSPITSPEWLTAFTMLCEFWAQARLGVSAAEQEQFFGKLLGDIDEPTTPFGLTEVHRDGRGVEEARVMLPSALNTRLRAHAQRLRVSLASLCHLAWGQVVARTSGREQVVFGTVLFGRMHGGADAEQVIGPFVNALPIRLNLDDTGVEANVRQTHAVLAESSRHEYASLALAQRCSGVPPPAPLFSALLNHRHDRVQTNTDSAADRPLAGVEWLGGQERTNYPVVLPVEDFGEAMGLMAQVVEPVSPARVCTMMERTLEQLAEALEQRPATPARTLDVLPAAERTLLLETWNATEAPYPSKQYIHELFEEQVERTPNVIAMVHDVALTYAELNAQANQLAYRLIALGVGSDRLVGLCVERRPHLVIGLLAILKASGAYVPFDPSYPRKRLQELVSDAESVVMLADAAGRQALALDAAVDSVARVSVDDPAGWATEHDTNPEVAGLSSRHPAYVIHTSGSTGTPKGSQNEHRAIVNRLVWMQRAYGLDGTDMVLQKTPYSFDVSVWELFWTLMYGATMLLAAPDDQRDPTYLVELIEQRDFTTVHFVPSMLSSSVEASGVERCTSLRRVICSGEELPVATLAACRRVLPSARLDNLYGPTEAAIDVTSWRCPDEFGGRRVPIGRPIANTQVYLLDADREPVPMGEVGEIYIGGVGVARGYLNRPELTRDRFVVDPFSGAVGARMYRTGDLARYLPDGNVEFLGRNDHQVKIRGHRIELGKIEARLAAHVLVRNAVVIAPENGVGNKRLVAYVTTDAEYGQELASTLREHLARQLPGYMVPSVYVRLDALPLTANGKLDRDALPSRDLLPTTSRPPGEAPPLPLERELMQLWTEMLGIPVMSTASNFFELGGHSLLLVQMGNRLGWLLYARALFDAATMERHRGYLLAMAADASQAVARAELLAPAERTLLLETSNATEIPYPSERCMHGLFEAQVARTPDAVAVVQDECQLTDRNVEFIRRNGQQVKIRGYRIKLGKIEARLMAHGAVREAVVIASEDEAGDKRLVAYVTLMEKGADAVVLATTLREHVVGQLPEYMVPSAYVRLEVLPLTPNGKLDRKALPMPDDAAVVQRGYEAPQDEVEQMLAGLWCELLRVERVGRQDHFFELGGHSLLVVRLANRLQSELDVSIDLSELFLFPQLAAFARRVAIAPLSQLDLDELGALVGSQVRTDEAN